MHYATMGIHERQRIALRRRRRLGKHAHARVEHVEDEPRSGRQVPSHRPEAVHQVLSLMQMEQ
jgi:hypothetical protein